jgi:hypothetical protein
MRTTAAYRLVADEYVREAEKITAKRVKRFRVGDHLVRSQLGIFRNQYWGACPDGDKYFKQPRFESRPSVAGTAGGLIWPS